MGGSKSTTTNQTESMDSMLQAYQKYLPGLLQSTSALQPDVAKAQLAATQQTQDAYDQLNLQELQKYGVPLAQAGQAIQRSNALAGGDINAAQIAGSGGQAAIEADRLARLLNPNYYGVQDAASKKAIDMLGAINLKGLTGGEQAAVERSLAQSGVNSGNLGLNNATNAVANAMQFGGAQQQKLAMLGQALGAANQTAQSAQSSVFNPINIALGQPNAQTMSNFGTGTFTNTNPSTQNASAANTFGMGQGFLQGTMQRGLANNTSNTQAQQPFAQTFSQIAGGIGSMAGGVSGAGGMSSFCPNCFIFIESYHGDVPWVVRHCRDRYYRKHPEISEGYKRMAMWLVPMMRKSKFITGLVWCLMVKPLTDYGLFIVRIKPENRKYRWARKFWLGLWYRMGKQKGMK